MNHTSGYEERRINERVASLEAANEFNKESLQEISNTLKEVVKTQALLANQRDEMLKIAESIRELSALVHDHDKSMSNISYRTQELEVKVKSLDTGLDETKSEAKSNTKSLRIAVGVLTTIVIPLSIAITKNFFGW